MSEFDDLRSEIGETRTQSKQAAHDLFLARERAKRLEAQQTEFERQRDPENERHEASRRRLIQERERLDDAARRSSEKYNLAITAEKDALGRFAALSDPREAIAQLNDAFPILLFPVRLETRFRNETPPELLVRIYPDDCSIDTFDGTLSEAEVLNAKLYWITMWEAGGIPGDERGAWRGLVAGHGSGRAAWIIRNYAPLNLTGKLSKPRATDVILTIGTETPLMDAEATATAIYWREIWLADGDSALSANALAVLEHAVGADRAKKIVKNYVPANIASQPTPPLTKGQVTVSVVFVIFPDSATLDIKRHSWSRAPHTRTLPDRFVFIGYAGEAAPLVVLGNPVPSSLIVGLDPTAPDADQMRHDPDGELIFPEEMRWMIDFQRAVDNGMALRIPLDRVHANGFKRILVVGLRTSADESVSQRELETLIDHHHYGRSGFELVPQGTPTNNTEGANAGYSRGSDADATFDDLTRQPLFRDEFDWLDKRDGQWLAESLGIDPDVLRKVHNSGAKDQADARAMNVALWPGTLGYWMETMMSPVFDSVAIEQTREFFNRFVTGRGAVPAIRIGRQPYGILPTTVLSRMKWTESGRQVPSRLEQDKLPSGFLKEVHRILGLIERAWNGFSANVSFAGKNGDPHQILLDIIGLHSGSVEFAQRYAESVEELYNRLVLEGLANAPEWLKALGGVHGSLEQTGRDLLAGFGFDFTGTDKPEILNKYFFTRHNPLLGPLIDDKPLSEKDPIRGYTADGKNYLQWLTEAARSSIDNLYSQRGFTADKPPPQALLYLMLRYALQLGYHDVSVRLHESGGMLTGEAAVRAKRDEPFIHISDRTKSSESRYQLLYKTEEAITGSSTLTVADYITTSLASLLPARYLREQIEALDRLKDASTARLERAFVEHLDCGSYRIDAWLLGLVNHRLTTMRNVRDRANVPARKGLYLGAYAWLEDLQPEDRQLTEVVLRDPELVKAFNKEGDPMLQRDSANEGYIHAPSLNHAVAAAVLRNGYISDASAANRQTMAVNLTSERVRTALSMLEGIRGGQKLGALLGYQFERGLHDSHGLVEVDKFIFDMRKAFPLASRLASTRATDPDVSIEAIEARNVMDGLALVNHIKTSGVATYPFGKSLPPASTLEAEAINKEIDQLRESHDAVADLALAEGVYQAVLGNYDRVASTCDAYSKGNFPPEPQVVQTPVSGIGLTHRVALHLQPGLDPLASPIGGVAMTPRAEAEPAINQWLFTILPPLADIGCRVSFRDSATNVMVEQQVTLRDLAIQPADVIRIVGDDPRQQMSELDDRIVRFVVTSQSPRPDTPVTIKYMETSTAPVSVFQAMPLVRSLRRLTQTSRPLQASDLTLSNEAKSRDDEVVFVNRQRVQGIRDMLLKSGPPATGLRIEIANFIAPIEALLADVVANRGAILANVDDYATNVSALLERAAAFTIPQTGWGFAYDFRQRTFRSILDKATALVNRWNGHLTEFGLLIDDYNNLPSTSTNPEKFALLNRAERLISATTTLPRPVIPNDLRDELVNVKQPALVAKRNAFDAIINTNRTSVTQLLSAGNALLPIDEFEAAEISFKDEEDDAVRFADDVARVAKVILNEIDRRLTASQDALTAHDGAANASDRVAALSTGAKALVGEDLTIIPEFPVAAAQGDEMQKAFAASGGLFTYLEDFIGTDFPVDTWLYGVARVRDKVRLWEEVVMLAGAFGRTEPELTPLQLPFIAGDSWLALEFHPTAKPDTDRLLYTAHFAIPFDKTANQCGLLLDEWSEIIPSTEATTGVAFHYDRPNSEAPQTMLLVTAPEFRGAWQWPDLVDALNETLVLAKLRAVEPRDFESSPYARFLPATIMAVTMGQISISANLALNNSVMIAGGPP
jgi:hypothetical protein